MTPDTEDPARRYARRLQTAPVPIAPPLVLVIVAVILRMALLYLIGGMEGGSPRIGSPIAVPLEVILSTLLWVGVVWLGVVLGYRTISAHRARQRDWSDSEGS